MKKNKIANAFFTKASPNINIFTYALFIKVLANVFIQRIDDAERKHQVSLLLSDASIVKASVDIDIIADALCSASQLSFIKCNFCIASCN